MKKLNTISLNGNSEKKIELYQGDLANLQPAEKFDLLVVSAFPNDYIPTPNSLIGALYNKGLSVNSLALDKEEDLRENFSCWLSKEIAFKNQGLHFDRILCFESSEKGTPPELVGNIFQALMPFITTYKNINTIAMPIVGTGDQKFNVTEVLQPLLKAAIHWMENGLPLNKVKIVTYSKNEAEEASSVFLKYKSKYVPIIKKTTASKFKYEIFMSYAREDEEYVDKLIEILTVMKPNIKIFLDRKDLNVGMPWQPKIFESLDYCQIIVSMFSPSYIKSKVCKEEFNIAWMISRESDNDDILFPIFLFAADLPTYMKYRGYADCREGNKGKINEVASTLLSALESKA